MNKYMEGRDEKGFTLIELLIAIVIVGILTAVAIVGIAGLQDKGTKSACAATQDAVKAAQAVHFANTNGQYPTSFADLTGTTPPELELSGGAALTNDHLITGKGGWTLGGTGTGTTPMVLTPSASCA
jgi:type IV pilus assembly protein PilA